MVVEFWFDFASTYSYLSVMRLESEARQRGVQTVWQPFLLGPIFIQSGWKTSPFNLYPAKGHYMWRDLERRSRKYGLEFDRPTQEDGTNFPQNGLLAARIALIGLSSDWGRAFTKAVFHAQFVDKADISRPMQLELLARAAGAPADILEQARSSENKACLRAQVNRAVELGIFGAPSFVIGRELFWGDDRLEDALDWVLHG